MQWVIGLEGVECIGVGDGRDGGRVQTKRCAGSFQLVIPVMHRLQCTVLHCSVLQRGSDMQRQRQVFAACNTPDASNAQIQIALHTAHTNIAQIQIQCKYKYNTNTNTVQIQI